MRFRAVALRYLVVVGAASVVALVWIRYGDAKVTILVAVMALIVSVLRFLPSWPWRWLVEPQPSRQEQVTAAGEALARSVHVQWMAEREHRRLEDAHSMAIRWSVDDRYSRTSVRAGTPVAGDLASVIDDFVARPRRLIVIGDPGSGKTGLCVLLTLELLKSSLPQRRVPVLFQVSSWSPHEHFSAWLVRRLTEDYPWLAEQSTYGSTACAELLSQQRLLPVLDGLDELPDARRAEALNALQRDIAGQPFVLTCRSDEFGAAQGDRLLKDALVISLLPLESSAAADYLLDSVTGTGLARWDPVLSRITDEPASTVGVALTKPLTLFLAQAIYQQPDTDPAELLDEHRFPTPEDIENRLLDAFVHTTFDARRPPPPSPNRVTVAKQWSPAQGERTLTYLATLLSSRKSRNLAWWELSELVPRWVFLTVRMLIGSVATAALCAVLFGLFGRPWFGGIFGLVSGAVVAAALEFITMDRPRRLVLWSSHSRRFALQALLADLEFVLIGGIGGGLIAGLLYGPFYGILAGMAFGVAFALVRRIAEPTEPKEAVSPAGLLASDRRAILYAALTGFATGALVGGFLGGVVGAREIGLVIDVGGRFQEGLLGAAIGAVLGGAVLGMMMHSNSASGRFLTAQLWLALYSHTPLRLMGFLDEAHRAGVLRQVGAYYQFRHASLQDRLATREPSTTRPPTVAAAATAPTSGPGPGA
jgi:hypothetical protein